jgi:predicted RNA binding protein YcfA (HicA-like mRNA interferase family)
VSKQEKLLKKLLTRAKDFRWEELIRLLNYFGYQLVSTGKTGGSRRKFIHPQKKIIISLHEPHPRKELKMYQIEQIIETLREEDLI